MAKLKSKLPSAAAIALRQAAAEADRLAADLRRRADLLDGAQAAAVKLGVAKKKKAKKAKAKKRATAKASRRVTKTQRRGSSKKASGPNRSR